MNKLAILLIFMVSLVSRAFGADPTYTKDIQPIFKNRCSKCHDYLPQFNWQDYDIAYSERDKIKQKVSSKEMPLGEDMPQSERDFIVEWVNTEAKK